MLLLVFCEMIWTCDWYPVENVNGENGWSGGTARESKLT